MLRGTADVILGLTIRACAPIRHDVESAKDIICNCLAVRQAARQLTQMYEDALAGTGLKATQFSVLARLSQIEPATMQELADDLVMDRTTLSHNLKPLERDGFISIGVADGDQRVRRLSLTKSGKTTLKGAYKAWKGAQDRFEHAFGVKAAADLRRELVRAVSVVS